VRVKIAPSILSADFARLGEQVAAAEAAGADYIHVDVMDGHFVPNLTMGPDIVAAVRRSTALPLDVHLMIESPELMLSRFVEAGASILTVHQEACPHLNYVLRAIRNLGVRAGVALNPATPVSVLEEVLDETDLILLMTVNPGFGGQKLIPSTMGKISRLATLMASRGVDAELEVDGGVTSQNAEEMVTAGARVLVCGSSTFNSRGTVADNLARLRDASQIRDNVR
jgi:ribulose-phosphate 3-epimerase